MSSSASPRRVLVVDDTPTIHEDFQKILCPASAATTEAMNELEAEFFADDTDHALTPPTFSLAHAYQGQEALALVEQSQRDQSPFQVAFVDMRMPPGWDGVETIRRLWTVDPRLQIVICTAYSDYSWKELTRSLGSSDSLIILKKPFDNIEVVQLAHALVRKWNLSRQAEAQVADLDAMVQRRTDELRWAEDRFIQAFNTSPLAQAIQTLPEGRIIEVNEAYEQLFDLPRSIAIGLTPDTYPSFGDPTDWREGLARLSAGESIHDTREFVMPDTGRVRYFEFFARPIVIHDQPHGIWIFRETTDHVLLEQQLRQSQKMEAIGQLAAGVAHDFNNVMTAVQGFTQMSLDRDDLAPDLRQDLEQVLAAGKRAAALTRQLLLFSRKQVVQEAVLSPWQLATELQPLLTRFIGGHHVLNLAAPPSLPAVRADQANIEQVILNLVGNARDALPPHGRIDLTLSAVTLTAEDARRHPDASAGDFVRIAVADNGSGIPADVLPRIFDPFFTTKPVGQGTGLGLATSYGIARQHRGWIEVETAVGHGTTFSVFLPAVEAALAPPSDDVLLDGIPQDMAELRGDERLLVVEDDNVVAQLIVCVLRRHGYATTCVDHAAAALTAWEKADGYDLVFSDVVMPGGMSGAELAAELLRRRPTLPIILATGYSETLLQETASRDLLDHCSLLLKPYDIGKLLRRIRQLLDAAQSN